MVARLFQPIPFIVDGNGVPLSGAKYYFYESGTSTPIDTYSNSALSTPNTNPVVADSAGRLGDVFLAADSYRILIKDANDNTIDDIDPYDVSSGSSFGDGLDTDSGGDIVASRPVNSQTGTSYTIQSGDRAKLITHSNASATAYTLPQANSSTFPDGWFVSVQNRGAGAVTITPSTSTIDGATSLILNQDEGVDIHSNGTNYFTKRAKAVVGLQTIYVPAAAMYPRTTTGAAVGTAESATNRIMIKSIDFDQTTEEYAQFQIAMPKSWDEGTMTAKFYWSAASGDGDVIWGIQGLALGDTDTIDTAFGTAVTVTDNDGSSNTLRVTSTTSAFTISNTPATNDLVTFQVYRDADAGGDTLNADARLMGVQLYFTTNAANDA